MAALGDSITVASASCGYQAVCAENSWATGTDSAVHSHRQRLEQAEGFAVTGYDDAVPGAHAADLATQVQQALTQKPDYVTVLVGANDLCATATAAMTATATYQQAVTSAVETLQAALPRVRIYLASVPDPTKLYALLRHDPRAGQVWAYTGACQSVLGTPGVAGDADRAQVHARGVAYNDALGQVCLHHQRVYCDGQVVFQMKPTVEDVSSLDYFHPSRQGQRAIADATWTPGLEEMLASGN